MRYIVFFLAFHFSLPLFSQAEFLTTIQSALMRLSNAKTAEDFQNVSSYFDKMSYAYKDEWLAPYYAAYANIMSGWEMDEKALDPVCDQSEKLLARAEALSPNNSEIYTLKAMIATQRLLVNPILRWPTERKNFEQAIQKAMEINPENPRPYLMKAQALKNTPSQFGGGMDVAKDYYQAALQKYKTFKPASAIAPNWGKDIAEQALSNSK